MNGTNWIYALVLVAGVFISSVSQILLKKSANKEHGSFIKEYLNPFLKEHGFKKYKSGWVKELEDGVFTIVIQKGRYNTKDAVSWGVRFNVIPKSFQEIKESKLPIDIVRIPNVGIRNLVPFEGMFHDLIGTFYYFDIHLIKSEEVSVEEQGKKVVQLFEEYVIPFSNDINTVADFDIALEKVNAGKRPLKMMWLTFSSIAFKVHFRPSRI